MMTLAVCLFSAAAVMAQPQGGKPDEQQRKRDFERIRSEKIAFITSELDLTPEEAEVFWPVYNQCSKEMQEAHKNAMTLFGEIRGKKGDDLSENELEKKLDAYVQASKASSQVIADWYPKFKKVLPIRKLVKLYEAEDAFQRRMIHNLRKNPSQGREPKEKR